MYPLGPLARRDHGIFGIDSLARIDMEQHFDLPNFGYMWCQFRRRQIWEKWDPRSWLILVWWIIGFTTVCLLGSILHQTNVTPPQSEWQFFNYVLIFHPNLVEYVEWFLPACLLFSETSSYGARGSRVTRLWIPLPFDHQPWQMSIRELRGGLRIAMVDDQLQMDGHKMTKATQWWTRLCPRCREHHLWMIFPGHACGIQPDAPPFPQQPLRPSRVGGPVVHETGARRGPSSRRTAKSHRYGSHVKTLDPAHEVSSRVEFFWINFTIIPNWLVGISAGLIGFYDTTSVFRKQSPIIFTFTNISQIFRHMSQHFPIFPNIYQHFQRFRNMSG